MPPPLAEMIQDMEYEVPTRRHVGRALWLWLHFSLKGTVSSFVPPRWRFPWPLLHHSRWFISLWFLSLCLEPYVLHRKRGISWLAERLLASQEILWFLELVTHFSCNYYSWIFVVTSFLILLFYLALLDPYLLYHLLLLSQSFESLIYHFTLLPECFEDAW